MRPARHAVSTIFVYCGEPPLERIACGWRYLDYRRGRKWVRVKERGRAKWQMRLARADWDKLCAGAKWRKVIEIDVQPKGE